MPKYPNIKVKIIGANGNAFTIIGKCVNAAKRAKVSSEEITLFKDEALGGDYNHLLQTCMKWFSVS